MSWIDYWRQKWVGDKKSVPESELKEASPSGRSTGLKGVRPPITRDTSRDLSTPSHSRSRKLCHLFYRSSPIAKRGVENLCSFITSEGFEPRATCQDEQHRARLQQWLDEWWRVNRWDRSLAKRYRTLSVEGEWFLWRTPPNARGISRLKFLRPERVSDVEVDELDAERFCRVKFSPVLEFEIDGQRGRREALDIADEDNPDGEVLYFQLNAVTGQTRGFSDLLVIADWLDQLETVILTEVERVQFQRAYVWDVALTGEGEESVISATARIQEAGPPNPGSVLVHNASEIWEPKAPELHLQDSVEFIKFLMHLVFGGIYMPEHFYATGGDVNKATSANMGTPIFAVARDRKMDLTEFFRLAISLDLRTARQIGVFAADGMDTEECFDFELQSKDPDRSAYDVFGEMLSKYGEALRLGRVEGWISEVEAAQAFRMAANGMGLGDFPGVDMDSLKKAEEAARAALEAQKATLGQQFPLAISRVQSARMAEAEEEDGAKKKADRYERDLALVLEDRADTIQLMKERAREHAAAMSSFASTMLLDGSDGLEIDLQDVQRKLGVVSAKFRDEYSRLDVSLLGDNAKRFIDATVKPWGIDPLSGSIKRPMSGGREEVLTWDRRVHLEVVKRKEWRRTGGKNVNVRNEAESWAYFGSEDFANEVWDRAVKAKEEGLTLAQLAGSLASDARVPGSLAGAMGDKLAGHVDLFQAKVARRAEALAIQDYAREYSGVGGVTIRRRFIKVKGSSAPCECHRHANQVYDLPGFGENIGPPLPLHPYCGCIYIPAIEGEPSDLGDLASKTWERLPEVFAEALALKEKQVPSPEGRVFTRTGGFLERHVREPAPVVPEWNIERLSLDDQLQIIEARGAMPARFGGHATIEILDSHFRLEGHDNRPRLYPLALEILRAPDARGYDDGKYYYFKRMKTEADGNPDVYMAITAKRSGAKEAVITWYRVDQGLRKANNPIKLMQDRGTMKWFL